MLKPGATNLGPINPASLAFGEILEFPFQTDVATRCFLFCQLKRFTNVPRDLSLRRFGYVLRFRVSGFRIQGFGKVFLMSCKRRARCMDINDVPVWFIQFSLRAVGCRDCVGLAILCS